MKSILLSHKYYLALTICALMLAKASSGFHLSALVKTPNKPDSNHHAFKVREVLLSQQLFVVELSPVKGSKPKDKLVNFKAELRDAFMVICYNDGKSTRELDWSMCPDGKCPIGKTYNAGTKEYDQLGKLIATTKANNQQRDNRIKQLKKQAK